MKRTKKKRPSPLVPKRLGKSAVRKGPARDEKHLAKVRRRTCCICSTLPTQAHHVRCLNERTMGVRVSDYLTVPLCFECHSHLHSMNEQAFWDTTLDQNQHLTDPAAWIASFSVEGAAAIAALKVG